MNGKNVINSLLYSPLYVWRQNDIWRTNRASSGGLRMTSYGLSDKIGKEQKSTAEEKTGADSPTEFLPQWIFFAVIALIPSIISFFRTIEKEDTFLTFFENYQILYVSFTLALVLFINQIQRSKFENRHYIYLFIILIGFAFYILLDNNVSFNLFSEKTVFAYINLCYLISVLLFGFFSGIQKILYLIPMFRRK
jgi:hypothetical protein